MAIIPLPYHNWQNIKSVENQLLDAMSNLGITDLPKDVQIDGSIHRFGKNDAGWYVIHPDGNIPAGAFGHWALSIQANFIADIGRKLTPAEQYSSKIRIQEAKMKREASESEENIKALEEINQIWENAAPATKDHWYLSEKKVLPHGSRIAGNGNLIFPLFNAKDELQSIQSVFKDSEGKTQKRYHYKTKKTGAFFIIGDFNKETKKICIAEGFATGASVYEATKITTVIAFDANNLENVTKLFREKNITLEIIIAGDNDESGTGQEAARKAATEFGAKVVLPPNAGEDFNDLASKGVDISEFFSIKKSNWLVRGDEFASSGGNVEWWIKKWIQKRAMMMLFGPSGVGKSFVVLDIAMRIATGQPEWMGHVIKQCPVLYLAGEGHDGLKKRYKAWKQYHYITDNPEIWFSESGKDLNREVPEILFEIESLPKKPGLIIVDTLHRFLDGDENDARDVRSMTVACQEIMQRTGASVLLVHHTGVSEEAQHRGRGSSAWKGNMDVEMVVKRDNGGDGILIKESKVKEGEELGPYPLELESVAIEGLFDEDGEQVTSAVVVKGTEKATKEEEKMSKYIKIIKDSWIESGMDMIEDFPYISRQFLQNYVVKNKIYSPKTADQYLKPSGPKFISELIEGGFIESKNGGFLIIDNEISGVMGMIKKSVKT